MKLSLSRKAQSFARVEVFDRRSLNHLDGGQPCAMHCFQLIFKLLFRFTGRSEKVSVEPLEFAVNPLLFHDCFNPVNGSRMALGCETRAARPVQTLKLVETVVERIDQMRRRPPGHASSDGSVVYYDN